MTRVINIKDAPPGWKSDPSFVYIGRPSKWGNPFPVSRLGRSRSIVDFIVWFRERLQKSPELWNELRALRGKTLVCFCKPLECHGDVMARMMEYPPVCPGTEGDMALRVPYDGPGLEEVKEYDRRHEIASIQTAAWASSGLDVEVMVRFAKAWSDWGHA